MLFKLDSKDIIIYTGFQKGGVLMVLHLAYHYLKKAGQKKPGLTCDIDFFDHQLSALKNKKYAVWNLTQWADAVQQGQKLPKKIATISFDDGLRDGFELAYPLLLKYGFSASFLIITCTLDGQVPAVIGFQDLIQKLGPEKLETEILPELLKGRAYVNLLDSARYDIGNAYSNEVKEVRRIKHVFNQVLPKGLRTELIGQMYARYLGTQAQQETCSEYFLTLAEIQTLANNGMDIVSHSHTHPSFLTCGSAEIEEEAAASKKLLMRFFSRKASSFGYPFGGNFTGSIKRIISLYYDFAFNYTLDRLPAKESRPIDLLDIPRVDGAQVQVAEL